MQRHSRTSKNKLEQQILVNLLRDARLKVGIKQADLATRLNVHQSYVSKYESGERWLDIFEIRGICLALDIQFTEFIDELEKRISHNDS